MRKPNAKPNDPGKAGQRASKPTTFGPNSRYAVYAIHTRFDAVAWVVADAEQPDDLSLPSIIRQEPSYESAIAGLPLR